jgi:hypothetical protein
MSSSTSLALRQIRRLAAQRRVSFTLKALRELAGLDIGMDTDDACDVLARVGPKDLVERVRSVTTGEWMYVLKPRVVGIDLYVKVLLRRDCLVISFHEDEGSDEEEDS